MSSLRNAIPRKAHKERSQPSEANKYTHDELILMKTQDIGYILQKLQSEKNVNDNLLIMEEAKSIQCVRASEDIPDHIKRKTAASYREVEARKSRVQELEKLYMDMARQKELQKKGRKRKLREDEIICPTSKPLYKWRAERKR
ncbi:hypothetical protein QYF36_001334 [Acer negundo]|nr:hypothetical protein QYF36_001334 [Acer negundo]